MTNKTQPKLERVSLLGRDGDPFEFTGVLLGAASSERELHTHDLDRQPHAPRHRRCSACRWNEVAIYRRYVTEGIDLETEPNRPRIYPLDAPESGDYVVHTVGVSLVPGEHRLSRIASSDSAFEVVELLTVRRPDEEPFMTPQSSRALARAAERDDDLRDAYINRAVV